jgi:hypothetical protein
MYKTVPTKTQSAKLPKSRKERKTHPQSVKGNFRTIVPSYENITVSIPHLAADVLLRVFQRDVHVAVHALQFAYLNCSRRV